MNGSQTISSTFQSLVFDCDGVILDSNAIKSDAFFELARPYGNEIASSFVEYHRRHGGVSRYRKLAHLRETLLGLPPNDLEVERLACQFSAIVLDRLLGCPMVPDLEELRRRTSAMRWMVVSGSDQVELREVFRRRGLDALFDGGVHGSPRTKVDILRTLSKDGMLTKPALFLGDSRLDHEAANAAAITFAFVSDWSEFDGWRGYCEQHGVEAYPSVGAVLSTLAGVNS